MEESNGERHYPPFELNPDKIEQLGRYILYLDLLDNSLVDSDSYNLMERIQADCPEIDIREEQVECLDALQQARDEGENKALMQMATGLGKTTVAVADVRRFLEANPKARVLFLSHQNQITEQAMGRFRRILGDRYTYGRFTGEGKKDYHEVTCLFASLQVMGDWREAFLKNEFDYIVVDESHHAKAPTYEPTIRYFQPQFLLGMTGTPDRHDMQDIREIFGPERYKKTLEEAIAEGLLTEAEYYVLIDEVEASRVLQDIKGNRFSRRQLNRTIFAPVRDEEMARIAKEKAAELNVPVRRLVFCESIQQTEEFAQYFDKASAIHSKMTMWEKIVKLHQFRRGEIETLLTVDMFNEGIDVPEINQVLFARITQSKTVFLQQLGRGLRKAPDKDKVQVLDFVANADRLTMLDRFWKRIKQYQRGEPEEPEIFRINIGDVQFNETLREVLDILDDIEITDQAYSRWSSEDSISYYQSLSATLNRAATVDDIRLDLSTTNTGQRPKNYIGLVKPFEGSLIKLRLASGYEAEASYGWTADDSLQFYKEASGDRPLTFRQLTEALARTPGLPGLRAFLAPFNKSMRRLQEAAGYQLNRPTWEHWTAEDSIKAYQQMSGNTPLTTPVLTTRLEGQSGLPSLTKFLEPFGGSTYALQEAAGYAVQRRSKTVKERQSWDNWTAEDSVRVYRELAGDVPLSHGEFTKLLQSKGDAPAIKIVLSHFEEGMAGLRKAAGHPERVRKSTALDGWTAEQSIKLYQELSKGSVLDAHELHATLKASPNLPSITAILRPFGKNGFTRLQRASGIIEPLQYREDWTAEQSISLYKDLSGDTPLSYKDLEKALKGRRDTPSMLKFLDPFEGGIRRLQEQAGYVPIARQDWSTWTAEDSISIYRELSKERPLLLPELKDLLKQRNDVPSISRFLRPFGSGAFRKLQTEAGYEITRKDWRNWSTTDSVRVYRAAKAAGFTGSKGLSQYLAANPELPGLQTLLRPFNLRLNELRQAAEVEEELS